MTFDNIFPHNSVTAVECQLPGYSICTPTNFRN